MQNYDTKLFIIYLEQVLTNTKFYFIKIPLKWTAIVFLKMELIPQNGMQNKKSKFPIEKIPKMEKGRWGLLQANFRKRRLFYSNKFISLGII